MIEARPAPRRVTPFDNSATRFKAGRLGVRLFLVSLGMLFGATLVVFVVIRIQTAAAWPTDLPALPGLLWLSTGFLIVSSGTMQGALHAARADHAGTVRLMMWLTLILGLAFLALQALCWSEWLVVVSERWFDSAEYRFALSNFYVLTGLHAAHVVGGLVPLIIVTHRSRDGVYTSESHAGLAHAATYWHFLDAVWLVLFVTLMFGA